VERTVQLDLIVKEMVPAEQKSLEEKEIDFFLDSENKKMVSNMMRGTEKRNFKAQVLHNASLISPKQ